ncbi:MAG: hypothetical protein ACT4PO_09505 [Actinomycetota bacterium]
MNWSLWIPLLVLTAAPVTLLMADRILGVPAAKVIRYLGPPALVVYATLIVYGAVQGHEVVTLLAWGALGGFLATIALDIIRLVGLRLGLFPMDMPMMFGLIALGHAPRLQRNMIGRLVEELSTLPEEERSRMMAARLPAMWRLDPAKRRAVVGAMMAGLGRLPEESRRQVMATQMQVLTQLPEETRLILMRTMDEAAQGVDGFPYSQPRGLPKIPMTTFRRLASKALPDTFEETGTSRVKVAFWGYTWHFLIGMSFGIMYTMFAGDGTWGLAFAWGTFVWLAMMVAMPPMMPHVGFPKWFPLWPLLAHLVMAVPIGAVALAWVSRADANAASLLRHF